MSRAWVEQQDDTIKRKRTRPLDSTESMRELTVQSHPQEGLRILARIIAREAAKKQQIKAEEPDKKQPEGDHRL